MKKIIILIFLFICTSLPSWALSGISGDFSYFNKITSNISRQGEKITFQTILLENTIAKSKLEIEAIFPVDEKFAKEQIRSRYAMIFNAYRDQPTPYEGTVTNKSSCSTNNLPKTQLIKIGGEVSRVLLLNASDRDAFGICEASQIKKIATVLIIYFKEKKKIMQFKSFSSLAKPDTDKILEIYKSLKVEK